MGPRLVMWLSGLLSQMSKLMKCQEVRSEAVVFSRTDGFSLKGDFYGRSEGKVCCALGIEMSDQPPSGGASARRTGLR